VESRPSLFSSFLRSRVGVETRTSWTFCTRLVSTAVAPTLSCAVDALPESRHAWTTRSLPLTARPDAVSLAPLDAEPATTRPSAESTIATSQSPPAALRRAVTQPAAGMVKRCWATPAPLRSPPVHDLSTALAAETD
jgi:hypothetical protein